MIGEISKYRYIGVSKVSFEHGRVYEAFEDVDDALGICYTIKDESGEWYCYGTDFFNNNFENVS